jgi:hypothetical protein
MKQLSLLPVAPISPSQYVKNCLRDFHWRQHARAEKRKQDRKRLAARLPNQNQQITIDEALEPKETPCE